MKKSLVVLLIAVLALSAVFADFSLTATGDVSASYTFDLTGKTIGYLEPALDGKITWTADLTKSLRGEGYPYVDVEGAIAFDFASIGLTSTTPQTLSFPAPAVKFSKFEIVGDGWKVNFIDNDKFVDYAVSAIDTVYKRGEETDALSALPVSFAWYAVGPTSKQKTISYTSDNFGTVKVFGSYGTAGSVVEHKVAPKWTDGEWKFTSPTSTSPVFYENEEPYTVSIAPKYQLMAKDGFTSGTNSADGLEYSIVEVYDDYYLVKVSAPAAATKGYKYQKVTLPTDDISFIAMAETKEFDITDALSAQLAAGYSVAKGFALSGKFAYDDVAALAFDAANLSSFDIAANVKLGFVDLSAYFATDAQYLDTTADDPTIKEFDDDYYLSAKAVVTLEDLGTVVTVTGRDLFNYLGGYPRFDVEAVNTVVDGYTFDAAVYGLSYFGGPDLFNYAKLGAAADYEDEGLEIGLGAEFFGFGVPVVSANVAYTGEDIKVKGYFAYDLEDGPGRVYASKEAFFADEADANGVNMAYSLEAEFAAPKYVITAGLYNNCLDNPLATADYYAFLEGLHFGAEIKSDKLVNGAELSLKYRSNDKATLPVAGLVTAAVKVTL